MSHKLPADQKRFNADIKNDYRFYVTKIKELITESGSRVPPRRPESFIFALMFELKNMRESYIKLYGNEGAKYLAEMEHNISNYDSFQEDWR